MRPKIYKNAIEFISGGHTLLGIGPTLKYTLYTQ